MQEVKTPKNRKSLLNQNTSPKIAMKDKITPNKTPNQHVKGAKSPFKKSGESPKFPKGNSLEANKTPNKTNKKRKSLPTNLPENEDVSPKKSKLEVFAGTSKLISSVSADASPAVKKIEDGSPQADGLTRSQRKRLKAKLKRKSVKSKQQEILEKLKDNDPSAQVMLKEISEKIAAIKQRPTLTSTSRRKLRDLSKLLRTVEGKDPPTNIGVGKTDKKDNKGKNQVQKINKQNKKDLSNVQKPKVVQNKVGNNQQIKNKQGINKAPIVVKNEDDGESEESSESDYDVEGSIEIPIKNETKMSQDDDDEEGDDATSDAEDDDDDVEQSDGDDNVDESGDDSDDELEDENDDDVTPAEPIIKKNMQNSSKAIRTGNKDKSQTANSKKEKPQNIEGAGIVQKGQSRYVLYVNNLAYDAEKQEIIDHFAKVGAVKDVRIPTDMKTKKPRGFAYLEVNDQETYEKALSLHHTILKGRRINVLYTLGGKKKGDEKKKEIKVKNFKLNAMRQQGMLAGSVKETQKRSARRAKKNNMEKGSE